jgi:methyl-accepting chemotaxis protein
MSNKNWLLPFLLVSFTSCGTVQKMNDLVNSSTCSIEANSNAIERANQAIQRNAQLVKESSAAIEENRKHLDAGG